MMRIWLTIFFFTCGCLIHSQVSGISQIKQLGNVIIIENSEIKLPDIPEFELFSSKLTQKDKKSKELTKRNTKKQVKNLYTKHSRKSEPETLKSQKLYYKNFENDTFFINSTGPAFSAVLSFNIDFDLKEYFDYWKNNILLSPNSIVKPNTYYYLFFKDTGKLYQFFNKPPPSLI